MKPGISDHDVLNLANHEEAILITADKDFGELVFRQGKVAPGIVLVRLAGLSPAIKAEIVAAAIMDHITQLLRSFTVIMQDSVRIRRRVFYDL
jgi:predicted nuclease of predicted toxin-antitoxin system